MRRTSDASMFMADGEPNGDTRAFAAKGMVSSNWVGYIVYVIANEGFGLGDGTGPAEESKRTKRIQGWSRQIGLGILFAIHTKLFSI